MYVFIASLWKIVEGFRWTHCFMRDLFLCGMHEVSEGLLLSFAPTCLGHIESFFSVAAVREVCVVR